MEKKKSIKKKTAKTFKKKPVKKKTIKAVAKKTKKTTGKPPAKTKVEKKKTAKTTKGEKAAKKPKKKPLKKVEAKKPPKATKEKKKIVKTLKGEKIKKEPKEIPLPKKIARLPQRTLKTIEETAEILKVKEPLPEKISPPVTEKKLPAEYGEDRITLMVIDPWKLFVYWEIKKSTYTKVKGLLVLRVYDVTGIYFDGKNANIVFDIGVFDRVGDSYIGVAPGMEFIVDIGALSEKGDFTFIARSNKVATPVLKVAKEEGVLPAELYEPVRPVGYL
jgi:hypothetical protein